MDNDLQNKQDPQAAERLALEWNEMECRFQNDKFWYFISDNDEGMQIDNQSIICRCTILIVLIACYFSFYYTRVGLTSDF